ncbi:hypothetical protein N9N67_08585 [Bacteriovoracaceae bacterium]|nr:hypothetical protein [Bacteriovoracaceae bacterium]
MSVAKVIIVDFDDSFTFNLLGLLDEMNIAGEVVHYEKYQKNFKRNFFYPRNVIIGPGPGHPKDYFHFQQETLTELVQSNQYNLMTVCLGHQLLLSYLGVEIKHSEKPVHGQQVQLDLTADWKDLLGLEEDVVSVQRYNSLAAGYSVSTKNILESQQFRALVCESEIFALFKTRILSYQFHPESIGTNFSQNFFQPFLRNLL